MFPERYLLTHVPVLRNTKGAFYVPFTSTVHLIKWNDGIPMH